MRNLVQLSAAVMDALRFTKCLMQRFANGIVAVAAGNAHPAGVAKNNRQGGVTSVNDKARLIQNVDGGAED